MLVTEHYIINIHKKTPVLKSILNKGLKIYYNETPMQMFSCEYCEIFLRTPILKNISVRLLLKWL